ncbi:type VI secretion system baseplate subunit TssG [uncultured Albimonas sp.]|uniref:type VI secretion system baseplate subunit TssG n=1 Tax=uncultured Albimonas sp. TaxID=1331701 RepID=UPI0030EBB670|tara:strand:- start:2626 stop:3675 length:1050 start_codon:yes stop_codon:yes gene_type:complete
MEAQKRPPGPDLTRLTALSDDPQAHHVYQALRLIEAAHPERPRLGRSTRPAQDPVRLGQEAELAFPPSTVAGFEAGEGEAPDRLTQRFFGLFGPNGPLPLHLTEHARDRLRNHRDPTFTAFADVFHHRMLSLLYRAWASGQPAPSFDRADDDPFGDKVAALSGHLGEGFVDRDAMPDLARRHLAGLLAAAPRSESGLSAILSRFFEAPVEIESFVGDWLHLEPHDRGRLGSAALGRDANLGAKVWSREARFRIRIGPLSLPDYERLLPGGESLRRLAALVRAFAGEALDWDLNLTLRREAVPPPALGGGVRLGMTAWIGRRPARDADDLHLGAPRPSARCGAPHPSTLA